MPDRNRTCNPQLRRLVLYPVELRALSRAFLNTKALKNWSGWRDSNSRHPGPKPGALPDYATPRESRHYTFLGHKRQFLRLLQKTISSVNKFNARASPRVFSYPIYACASLILNCMAFSNLMYPAQRC